MANQNISKILVAVDLSSCSRAAFEFACSLAIPFGATIDVLFVEPRPHAVSTPGTELELGVAREELHRFVSSVAQTPSVEIRERVECGDPHTGIVLNAERGGFDLIVLGTHGRTGRTRALAGSVAESVVRTATCPVITVRERE